MTDASPPTDAPDEASNEEPSLAARILQLQQQHRKLDEEIRELYGYSYRDQLHLQRLKREKLRIKDVIERLKDESIPDLNA